MTTAPMLHLEKFKKHPFLNGLASGHLAALEESAMEMNFAPNDFIYFEGQPINRFYLILEGSVVLRENKFFPFQIVHQGEVLGWSALFPPYLSHFEAQALTHVKAIFFYSTWVLDRCEMDHDFGYEMMKRMAEVLTGRLQARRKARIVVAASQHP
jgi:CRP/FNR family transcriptional regulator, cyclic AMP receptor protein